MTNCSDDVYRDEELGTVVAAFLGCPACGKRRVDELVIHNDETVHCETCGHDYALPNVRPTEA